jgi:hypothetical protein
VSGPAPQPLEGRQRLLVACLRGAFALVAAMAAIGALLPEEQRERASTAIVVFVIAVPMVRVAWLGLRWLGRGDRPYAVRALALLLVMTAGALLAL